MGRNQFSNRKSHHFPKCSIHQRKRRVYKHPKEPQKPGNHYKHPCFTGSQGMEKTTGVVIFQQGTNNRGLLLHTERGRNIKPKHHNRIYKAVRKKV